MSLVRRVAVSLALVIAASTLGSVNATAEAPAPGASGVGDPYFPRDGNGGLDVGHYDITQTVRWPTGRVSGVTRLSAVATQALSRFNLDLLLTVSQVWVNGARAAYSRPNRHELVITPVHPIAAGERFTVKVIHDGYPAKIRHDGERGVFANGREMIVMGEPHAAAWWYAANDHPRDKATYDVTTRVRRGKQVVSNGNLISQRRAGDWTVFHWRAHQPMAPYLAFFAAGGFGMERGRTPSGTRFVLAVSRALSSSAQREAWQLMRRTGAVQSWLEQRLGAYPFDVTGGLTTSIRMGFALETQTRPMYPAVGGVREDWVLAHELSHQWFGDAVSVESWRDIVLNEGLATYMQVWWTQRHSADQPASMRTWLQDTYDDASDDFWTLRIGDPGPVRLFDEPVYVRGAMFFQAIRNVIGEAPFRALLRGLVTSHRYRNASIADFQALAEQLGGQDLDALFDAWLMQPTKPAHTEILGLAS